MFQEYEVFHTKSERREQKRMNRANKEAHSNKNETPFTRHGEPKKLEFLSKRQENLYYSIKENDQTMITGPAGCGKSYVALSVAAEMFMKGEIRKIIITRPVIGVGRTIGLLPGSLEEKMAPWLAEALVILEERMGKAVVECNLKRKDIEIVALEYIRGRTFDNAFVYMTEAQNSEVEEMKAFVTRIGQNSKIVLDGDILQSDLKKLNGLSWAYEMAKSNTALNHMTGFINFTSNDVVRSGLCGAWVKAIWGN